MKFNGNLTLNPNGLSQIENVIIERVAALPAVAANEKGRIVFLTTTSTYYFNDGAIWTSFSTGGNAALLQTEVDQIESALGTLVAADGTFTAAGATFLNITGATSITDILVKLDAAIAGKDQLSELLDVVLATPTNNQVLQFNSTSGKWENSAILLAEVTDVTSTVSEVNQLHTAGAVTADFVKLHAVTSSATELNILTSATLTTTELNYVTGVTSSIQTQLNNKQPLDTQLTSISGLAPVLNDVMFGDGLGGFVLDAAAGARSRLGLVIGTDVQAYDADLGQIAAFAPTISQFMVGTGGVEGNRWVLQSGATARTSLGLGDIATLDAASFIRTDGTSTITADIKLDGFKLTNVGAPLVGGDVTNKTYVDARIAGLSWKQAVRVATTADVASLTGLLTIDGVTLLDGDRVLVKNQTAAATNGIYVAAVAGWVRATDFDQTSPIDEINGAAVFVRDGTVNADQGFTQINTVAVVGTDAIAFTSFSGATSFVDGIGLKRTGNIIDVNLGGGIKELPSDEIGVDVYNPASAAIILTLDGSTRDASVGGNPSTAAQLHLLTHIAELNQDIGGLYIVNGGVTESHLAASVAGAGLTGGAGSALAVVSAPGTASTVGTLVVTADSVGVALGTTSTTAAPGNHIHTAAAVTFDNTLAGLAGAPANVQAAVEAVDSRIDAIDTFNTNIGNEVDAIEAAVGLSGTGAYVAHVGTNYLDATTTMVGADLALDGAVKALDTAVTTKINSMYHLYTSSVAGTVHTVTHNIGQKYCVVTVVDSTDNVIIPQSIVFNTANQLTVSFNAPIDCVIVVVGLA